jgi:hypothetical protein
MNSAHTLALPDFELAELQGFDPHALKADTDLGGFILLLAAIFNDLKGAAYCIELVRAAFTKVEGRLSWTGQVSGMSGQVTRVLAGILVELMQEIGRRAALIDSTEFKALVEDMPLASRRAWQDVRLVALKQEGKPQGDTDLVLLVKIRGALAFHYEERALRRGYERGFASEAHREHRDKAVVSDGDSMEGTRFYFADLAMEEGLRHVTGLDLPALQTRVSGVAQSVNNALKHIVMTYIKQVAQLSPYPRSI